jgi:hypothetical protein
LFFQLSVVNLTCTVIGRFVKLDFGQRKIEALTAYGAAGPNCPAENLARAEVTKESDNPHLTIGGKYALA